jgi:outer membrane lipoprotein SlyB
VILKTILGILLLSAVFALAGCASSKRPVLYPNPHLNAVGQQQAEADIDACMRAAEASGANSGKGGDLAKGTAKAGAVGATTGAVVGAISSNTSAGRGAAIGGAGAATAKLVGGAFDSSEPTQVYLRYVEMCLRDKGYQPIGWR